MRDNIFKVWMLLFFSLFVFNSNSMEFINIFNQNNNNLNKEFLEVIGNLAQYTADNITEYQLKRYEDERNRIYKVEEQLKNSSTEKEKLINLERLRSLETQVQERNRMWDQVRAGIFNLVPTATNTILKIAEEEANAHHRLNELAINAEFKRREVIEKTRMYIDALKDPQNAKLAVLAITCMAVGVFGAWHGIKIGVKYLDQWLGAPTLAQETSIMSFGDRVKGFLFGKEKLESNIKDVVLEPKLSARIEELTHSIENIVKNNSYFRHVLLYGPPGTGKTMVAMRIARSVGLEYIYFAASSLDQYSLEEALIKLKDLFEYAKNSSKPIMIIIDESEILFANRDKNLSEKTQKMLNLILTYTGTETNKFVIFGLTNRPDDIDPAFLNRCDEQIEIGIPGKEQVKQILKMYIDKFLVKPAQEAAPKLSFLSRLMGKKAPARLKVAENIFSDTSLDKIASDLYNNQFVGRDIAKTVIAIQHAAYATKDVAVTREVVNRVLNDKIRQKQTELNKFKSIV